MIEHLPLHGFLGFTHTAKGRSVARLGNPPSQRLVVRGGSTFQSCLPPRGPGEKRVYGLLYGCAYSQEPQFVRTKCPLSLVLKYRENLGQERLSSTTAFSLLPVGDTIATKKPPLPSSNFGLQYKKFSFEGIRVSSPPPHVPFSGLLCLRAAWMLLLKAKSLCVRGAGSWS